MQRNKQFYDVMEASYNETALRCKQIQQSLTTLETKYREDMKQADLDLYRLKERFEKYHILH